MRWRSRLPAPLATSIRRLARHSGPGPRPRPEILDISPYIGGESNLPGVNRTIKLSSNEGAFGVPPAAQAA